MTGEQRYIVCGTGGYSHTGRFSTSYFVADRYYCYREVASFAPAVGDTTPDLWRRLAAERECDRLNALETGSG